MYASIIETELNGTPVVTVATKDGAQATVSLLGGQVLHWKPAGGRPWLYLSDDAVLDGSVAIRGGIPVCFPQFANQGTLPKHGLVRTRMWSFIERREDADNVMLTFGYASNADTEAIWPHSFDLELTISVGGSRLDVELAITNNGYSSFAFTTALHTYLHVDEVELVRLEGLKGKTYTDKLDSDQKKTEVHEALVIEDAVDRIYTQATKPLHLIDGNRSLQIVHEQFPDVVVWNPWEDATKQLTDMPDRDFRRMLCVEAAVASQKIELDAEGVWWGRQSLIDA